MLKYTKAELQEEHSRQLNKLLVITDGYYHLAMMLGIPPNTAKGWEQRGRISKAGAKQVEAHPTLGKKFKAKQLRPEL